MQKIKGRIMAVLIAAILTVSIGASMTLIPSAGTGAFASMGYSNVCIHCCVPNPVGVGQTIDVYMWLDPVYGAAAGQLQLLHRMLPQQAQHCLANDYRFQGYQYTITTPNGTSTAK